MCILVDQFEELFGFVSGKVPTRLGCSSVFWSACRRIRRRGLYAILTMRSEFLGACARFKGLAETVNETQYLLPRMERSALLRAIREPATLYNGEVSRELAERLIADAGGGQDQLPLIQHGLMLLWRRKVGTPSATSAAEAEGCRGGGALPNKRARRGASGSRTIRAPVASPSCCPSMPMRSWRRQPRMPDAEKIVEHLFRALTDINAEGSAVRRPQTLAELVAVTGSDEYTLKEIIDQFRAEGVSFLTPYGDAQIELGTLIDISHEALIRCWRKIADTRDGWLQREFRDGLIWQSLRLQAISSERTRSRA